MLTMRSMMCRLLFVCCVGCGTRSLEVNVLTGVTQEGSQATRWLSWSKRVGYPVVKCAGVCLRRDGTPFFGGDLVILCCREKHRREVLAARTLNRHR